MCKEVAGDIAFALHRMDLEEMRKKAEEVSKKSVKLREKIASSELEMEKIDISGIKKLEQ